MIKLFLKIIRTHQTTPLEGLNCLIDSIKKRKLELSNLYKIRGYIKWKYGFCIRKNISINKIITKIIEDKSKSIILCFKGKFLQNV